MNALEKTQNSQRRAAAPIRSAFVMANAGSGKTRVLTNRVARLLLADTPPQKILCITFTKAAAAEMADRLFSVLGKWALASDETLTEALNELEGEDTPRDPAALAKARRLFARALETPGGLKIQTIHSFCESVLRRFPLEAGAPPGFTVIEDAAAAELMHQSLDRLACDASADPGLAAAFDRLSVERLEDQLRALLTDGAVKRAPHQNELESALENMARRLGAFGETDPEKIKNAFLDALVDAELKRAMEGLAADGKQPKEAAQRLAPYFSTTESAEKWAALEAFLLTSDKSKPRARIASAATDKIDPWVRPFVDDLSERLFETIQQVKAIDIYHDTAAFWRLSARLRKYYEDGKAARAALDFNDLVLRARALFHRVESAWIMYKLDYGVDHILVDEAQDTSPDQWAVIESLFEEFFSGAGARPEPRSFFAVGDLKQSIYSFQGADVALFKQKEVDLGARLAQVTAFESLPLDLSFRTTAPVLSFVDAAFADVEAREGLGDVKLAHGVFREGHAGLVELWPLTPLPEKFEVNPWDAPVDAPSGNHPVQVLCERIAATLRDWLEKGERLESKSRAVRPGDVLILVQSRGALFSQIIRSLSAAGVPVAGPDRLKLNEDPAVEDLISFARFALCPSDDLSLAEVLKSPLFGFGDDEDLFPLAHERGKSETLWGALRRRACEQARWSKAAEELSAARIVAAEEGPFAFFSTVLAAGSPSGRKRFFDRMGKAHSDAIDELLRQAIDFENANPRSLRNFIAWFDHAATEIKREMERQDDAVRVMTVHGAKGLEAEIVFLLDAHREVSLNNIGPIIDVEMGDDDSASSIGILTGPKANDVEATADARAAMARNKYEEYRRLFYVAATRARDRLYICGVESGRNKDPHGKPVNQKTWHALAEDAFARLDYVETGASEFWENGGGAVQRLSCAQTAPLSADDETAETFQPEAPEWMFAHAPQEKAQTRLTPSKLGGEENEWGAGEGDASYSPLRSRDKYFRGRILHRLLELLPDVTPDARSKAADKLLARLAGDVEADERARWRDEVLTVLSDPAFAEVFMPDSMAEVPVAGELGGQSSSRKISGQIDRLAVTASKVFVVDYKTNRPPPKNVGDIDFSYVAQMAAYRALLQKIYPDREVVCALLWTYDARLMLIPDNMLDKAAAQHQLTG
ncbi:double-strand break repair helicase AddA [Hyphococcus sp.]|uniref:double-strand break repair helicase AddA n=1 Tax=Hyphococcus sp. TaxID=2038636 RepID=UPI003CCBB5F5